MKFRQLSRHGVVSLLWLRDSVTCCGHWTVPLVYSVGLAEVDQHCVTCYRLEKIAYLKTVTYIPMRKYPLKKTNINV